jgi:acyl-CoA thioesterase I
VKDTRDMQDTPSVPYIVCFGDSLTVGYQSPTSASPNDQETPYGGFLRHRLGSRATVSISGVCGETTREMVLRFRRDVLERAPQYVVVLGGTNDLGWNVSQEDILANLVTLYEQALHARIQPVAVTVPSIRPEGDLGEEGRPWLQGHIESRHILNRLLAERCAAKGIPCVDLFGATVEPGTLLLAADYSNDGLHLTTLGYQRLAELLFEQVFSPRLGGEKTGLPTGTRRSGETDDP